MESISFDRAAEFYDATRGHSPKVAQRISDSLHAALPERAHILEIGVGTGRISRPILENGLTVYGVDLSMAMMQRLLQNLDPGVTPPGLAQANAIRLPFASNSLDAVLAVHVFHLIAGWQQALQEIQRVLRPGGSLFVGSDWRPQRSPISQVRNEWRRIVQELAGRVEQPGVRTFDRLVVHLLQHGASFYQWNAAEWTSTYNLSEYIDRLEARIYSSTWLIPDEVFPACIQRLRAWAQANFHSLDQEIEIPRRFVWQRYRWVDAEPG